MWAGDTYAGFDASKAHPPQAVSDSFAMWLALNTSVCRAVGHGFESQPDKHSGSVNRLRPKSDQHQISLYSINT